jgi:Xaa-Pro aminopeptidase
VALSSISSPVVPVVPTHPVKIKRKRDAAAMPAAERLAALRVRMAALGYDAFIVPSEDAHMSEYVAACDERRAFLSGFDGSAGTVVVTRDAALCWTDGRYFVQARAQLDPACFRMMRMHEDVNVDQWLAENMPMGSVVAVDGATVSVGAFERMETCLTGRAAPGVKLIALPPGVPNPVDDVWADQRPPAPASNVFVHRLEFAGQSVEEKLALTRSAMCSKDVTHIVITGLDEVAWLFNLRGSDVEYNPVFWSYAVVSLDDASLFVNAARLSKEANLALAANKVSISDYSALLPYLMQLPNGSAVWIDPAVCNYAIFKAISASRTGTSGSSASGTAGEGKAVNVTVVKEQGPIPLAKAKKNETEIRGMRSAHVRDAVAMVKFLHWLEDQVTVQGKEPTECEAADKLDGLRAQQARFVSLSFPTISSAGSNGAIVHYRPMPETCSRITRDVVYLVDSGGQYLDGTTDVTRTMHFGTPSAWERECFTLVLRGHIALDTAVFPKGTTGHILDAFARRPLWAAGLDYKHGTGHGVGCFLNVHEGPHVLSFKPAAQATALAPGFLSSNEPGYYQAEEEEQQQEATTTTPGVVQEDVRGSGGDATRSSTGFGIRIENVCVVVDAPRPSRTCAGVSGLSGSSSSLPPRSAAVGGERPFYAFEHLTLVPLQRRMMEVGRMSALEIGWVDAYHAECRDKLSPLLADEPAVLAWLHANTVPVMQAMQQ